MNENFSLLNSGSGIAGSRLSPANNNAKQSQKKSARPESQTDFIFSKVYKPSSVPHAPTLSLLQPKPTSIGPLSFIYDCNHSQPPATYPSTSGEQPLIVDIHGLATRKAYCRRTLLPSRWALTPPFHPYHRPKSAAVILCYATTPSRTSSR